VEEFAKMMDRANLITLARQKAAEHQLDPELVCAIVEQESSWNPWSVRFEPDFLARYIVPQFQAGKISSTEGYARAFSWGLMQVMGETAREEGFTGDLASLCDPEIGLEWGCRRFAAMLRRAGDVPDAQAAALLHYNGGANPNYPGQVLARIPNYSG
jgi:soluble lytic murein transglycosylase-like protein